MRGGPERVGVFGGTFDPVHVGHVAAASEVRQRLELDRMLVVPAGDPWQKGHDVVASAADRLAMVEAAIEGIDGLHISPLEVDRDAPSVTADTLEALAAPSRRLYLVLGADAVANMHSWRRLEETRHLAALVVVERAGEHAESPGPGWQVERVPIPRLDVSSTDIRDRVADGRPIDGLVPPAVITVIRSRGLYTRRR
ncbi:MAG: nicotinate-nucleotide adenylyltransferase [Acidimicrobiia bacterium]